MRRNIPKYDNSEMEKLKNDNYEKGNAEKRGQVGKGNNWNMTILKRKT